MNRSLKIIFLLIATAFLLVQCYPTQVAKTSVSAQPKSAFRYYENALVAKFDGHWQEALKQVNKAIALNDKISLFFILKAQIFDSLHQADSAIYAYQQALNIRPHAPDVLQKIGELYIAKGERQTGILYLKKAFAFDETQTDILLRIARLYLNVDSLRLAQDVLSDYEVRMELAHSPPKPSFYLMEGDMAYEKGDWALAAHYFKACPCKKCFSREQAVRAFDVFFKIRDYDAYFALLIGVDKQKFKNGTLFYYRGLYYKVIGNLSEAQHQFELALKHGNTKPELFWELAQIYFQKNKTMQIKALYRKLQTIRPDSPYLKKMKALF